MIEKSGRFILIWKMTTTKEEILRTQSADKDGKIVQEFKGGKKDVLYTTKCSRGIDFPGETCNSILLTKFPYPNVSSLFWKILKLTKPQHYQEFYMDKAKSERSESFRKSIVD